MKPSDQELRRRPLGVGRTWKVAATQRGAVPPNRHRPQVLGAFVVAAGFLSAMTARPVLAAASDRAQATYSGKCAMCHGADGSGDTVIGKSAKIPDLRSAPVQSQTDAQLEDIVSHGKGVMPAFGSSMSNDEIHSTVLYLREIAKGK
jgi:mono/diheme cytochrome c family protein